MSTKNEKKKEKELEVLNKAIKYGIASNQETTRRISLMLSNSEIREMEEPDFFLINDDEIICYGVEHFRVDQHIKEQHGKIGAASVTFSADNERIRQRYNNSELDTNLIRALDEIDQNVEKQLNRTLNATIEDLLVSFRYMLDKKSKRLNNYRDNINKFVPNGYEGKTVLLIQIVTDFSRIYTCSYKKNERNTSGLMPMFEEVIELLKRDSLKRVDYFILFFESYFGNEAKTVVLDNKSLEVSLKNNGIRVFKNCMVEKYIIANDKNKVNLKVGQAIEKESQIDIPYSIDYKQSKDEFYVPAIMTAAKAAMAFKENRIDFVTDYCVLYFLEVFGPNVKGWKKYKDTDLYQIPIMNIDQRVIKRRSDKFDCLYPLK